MDGNSNIVAKYYRIQSNIPFLLIENHLIKTNKTLGTKKNEPASVSRVTTMNRCLCLSEADKVVQSYEFDPRSVLFVEWGETTLENVGNSAN